MYPPKPWDVVLPNTSNEARDLVSRLVTYQSTDRMSAEEVRDLCGLIIVIFHKAYSSSDRL